MFNISIKYLSRLLIDFTLTTVLLALSLNFSKIWGPITRRGFFCGDESLMYPLHKDTITYPVLYIISLGLPLTVIVACSILEKLVLNSRPVKNGLRLIVILNDTVLPFLFGYAAQQLIKQIAKFSLGRLRPYFFAVCRPLLLDGSTCEFTENYQVYIEDYECQGAGEGVDAYTMLHMEKAMRSSFPSGHTSMAFYGIAFTVYYLQRFSKSLCRYRASFSLFVPLLQVICVLLAWFVAISRVLDYKHHWSDVLAGGLLGLSVAIAVAYYVDAHIRSDGTFFEAIGLPKRTPPSMRCAAGGDTTVSLASTHFTDVARSGESLNVPEVHVVP